MGRIRRFLTRRFGVPGWGLIVGAVVLIGVGSAGGTADRSEELERAKSEAAAARQQLETARADVNSLNRRVNELAATPPTTAAPATTPVPTTARPATTTTEAGPRTTFGNGTFRVGIDIQPGTYVAPGGSGCYWERQAVFGGSGADAIIANEFAPGGGQVVVTIQASDKGFKTSGCGTWRLS